MLRKMLVSVAIGSMALLAAGCNDKNEQQLKELRETNQGLLDSRWALQEELTKKEQEIEALKARLAQSENMSATQRDQWNKTLNQWESERRTLEQQLADARAAADKVKGIEGVSTHRAVDGIALRLDNAVFFASGKATLTDKGQQSLNQVVALLQKEYAGHKIRVEGHTDSDPINHSKKEFASNWELASSRSLAVLHFLAKQGINESGMYSAAYADTIPVAPNDSNANKAKNRRVEIVVIDAPAK